MYFSTSGFNHTRFQVKGYNDTAFQTAYPLPLSLPLHQRLHLHAQLEAAARSIVRQKSHLLSSSETPRLVTPLPWTSSGLPAVPAGNAALSLPLLPWTNSGLPAFLAGNVTLSLPFKRAHWTANE